MNNNELLQQFGQSLGINNLHLDSNKSCQLCVDGKDLIILNEIDNNNILLNGVVGKFPEAELEQAALTLLSMNMLFAHIDGPYVTWEPQHNTLLIAKAIYTPEMDVIALQEQISYLLQNLQHIGNALTESGTPPKKIEF